MTDFTRLTRSDWLGLADGFYRHLDTTFARLTARGWERRTAYLGWRARDVLAHMTSAMPVNFREVLGRALADNPTAPPEFDRCARTACGPRCATGSAARAAGSGRWRWRTAGVAWSGRLLPGAR